MTDAADDNYLAALLDRTADAPDWLADCDLSEQAEGPAHPHRRAVVAAARATEDRNIELPQDLRHERRAKRREFLHALHVANAAQHIAGIPARGVSLHAVMKGNFHAWDLVPAVLKLAAPATIADLYVVTLSFNNGNADELIAMLDAGTVGRVTFLCSCYFKDASEAEYAHLAGALAARGQRVLAMRTHAKILLLALSDGRRIVVESSANLRSCRNVEQFCMTHDAGLYEFHRGWIEQLITPGTPAAPPLPAAPGANTKEPSKHGD